MKTMKMFFYSLSFLILISCQQAEQTAENSYEPQSYTDAAYDEQYAEEQNQNQLQSKETAPEDGMNEEG
jgi:hypothetical protein